MAAEGAISAAVPLDPPFEPKPVNALLLQSLKRTFDLFAGNYGQPIVLDEAGQRIKISCKVADEYAAVEHLKAPEASSRPPAPGAAPPPRAGDGPTGTSAQIASHSATAKLIDSMPARKPASAASGSGSGDGALVVYSAGAEPGRQTSVMQVLRETGHSSAAVSRRLASKWPKPEWHAPWKMYRVVSGHLGWVRSIAIDPGNEWFVTGSADRTIKIWDMASAQLKLTLTGHIEQVTGLAVSARHPYMFSCGLDKQVKCWDMEQNKVIRNYHGHLSGIYSIALHPTMDVLFTGGRDSVCRVWDMRTRLQIFCLSGHDQTVCSVLAQGSDPQVITGSHDSTIRLWDLRKAKTQVTLTHHKKSVRAMAMHPKDFAFGSASADNIKKYKLPDGEFLHNMLQTQKAIVNTMAINEDNVMATGGDDGSLWFWDWKSGHCFQQNRTQVQPGSLESEAGIHAAAFDQTGSRLITCETDKTIKMWKENDLATPESHPGETYRPPKDIKRF